MGGPVHLCPPEQHWINSVIGTQQTIGGVRDDDHRTRNETGPIHRECGRYANLSILFAATLLDAAMPTTRKRPGTDRTRTSEHGDPTAHRVVEQIDQADRAMHTWAHIYHLCPLCPDTTPPHDRHDHIGMLTDTNPDLTDTIMATSVLSTAAPRHIQQLNIAQQTAAAAVLDQWGHDYRAGAEPDELRRRVRVMRTLAGRMQHVCNMIGAPSLSDVA